MWSFARIFSSIVILIMLLAGCSIFERQLTASEKELCNAFPEIPSMFRSLSGGTKSINEVKGFLELVAQVESEHTERNSSASSLLAELGSSATSLAAAVQGSSGSNLNLVEEFGSLTSKKIEEVSTQVCGHDSNKFLADGLDLSLVSIYPEGAWSENASQNFVVYSFQPTTDLNEFDTGSAASISDTPNWADVQHSMSILCSKSPKMQSVYLSKNRPDPTESDPDFMLKKIPMGPDGPATFEYQLDDNSPKQEKGWVMNDFFFPFMSDKSQKSMTSGATRFGQLILNSGATRLGLKISRAGATFEATFFIHNAETLKPMLEELGCFR